jgi:precorrin-6A/cobalt-precorrin-6A reductase
VTKDSGKAGGVPAKIEAARTEGCQVVVVQRPGDSSEASFADLAELIAEVQKTLRSRA